MMIQELRIGNYIQLYRHAEDSYKSIHKIKGFFFEDTLNDYAVELEDGFIVGVKGFRDIPLTEDILLKCGAKLEGSEWQIEYDDTAFIFEGSLGRGFYYTGGEGCKLSVLFYNLHELQNLFRPITGEELNVEL